MPLTLGRSEPSSPGTEGIGGTSSRIPLQNLESNQQPGSSPTVNARRSTRNSLGVKPDIPNLRVSFIVRRGLDYKLAQIRVRGRSCRVFFSTLKERYYNLRRLVRGWFGVWRYSHCEFYMVSTLLESYTSNPRSLNNYPIEV